MADEFDKRVKVENGEVHVFTFSPDAQKRDGRYDEIGFDTTTPINFTATNLTLPQAKELVNALVDAIEEIENPPF